MNSCRNTLYPLQNIKKCCSSSTWFCLQTKQLLSSTGMGTPQISYFPVCIRVQLEETQLVIKPILGAAGWEPHGSSPTHARRRQTRSYPLLLVCPRDTPNIWCKFSHTSPVLRIRSGQVKKCFLSGERASGRKKSVVNSVYLKERHGAYCFSTLTSAKVIWGLRSLD